MFLCPFWSGSTPVHIAPRRTKLNPRSLSWSCLLHKNEKKISRNGYAPLLDKYLWSSIFGSYHGGCLTTEFIPLSVTLRPRPSAKAPVAGSTWSFGRRGGDSSGSAVTSNTFPIVLSNNCKTYLPTKDKARSPTCRRRQGNLRRRRRVC